GELDDLHLDAGWALVIPDPFLQRTVLVALDGRNDQLGGLRGRCRRARPAGGQNRGQGREAGPRDGGLDDEVAPGEPILHTRTSSTSERAPSVRWAPCPIMPLGATSLKQ